MRSKQRAGWYTSASNAKSHGRVGSPPKLRAWIKLSHPERMSVLEQVAEYSGEFQFLQDMKQHLQQNGWRPTPQQGDAILRSLRHPQNRKPRR